MRHALLPLCVSALLVAASAPSARPHTFQYSVGNPPPAHPVRWNTSPINIVLSTSLRNPPANIKAGSDAEGAARRALRRWSEASNVRFNVTVGETQLAAEDGLNVITVSAPNGGSGGPPGQTRMDLDTQTGLIFEVDIAINPNLPFSTDGTPDTFDLESTFVHQIGHLLGLDHTGVVGASMQPRQERNSFGLPQTAMRTLSDDDLAGISALYGGGTRQPGRSISGRINYPAGAHVFAESVETGRLHGSAISTSDGGYEITHVPLGEYRVVVEYLDGPVSVHEITEPRGRGPYAGIGGGGLFPVVTAQASVTAAVAFPRVNFAVGGAKLINLGRHGLRTPDGAVVIHGGPVPLTPGAAYRYYVAGDGVDQIPAANFSFTTPFIVADPASFAVEDRSNFPGLDMALVSFDIRVADTAKVGEYSLRAQAASGEVAYLAGALTVDPYTDRVELNPIDAHDFFVRQQYRDFLSREPEEAGFNAWLNVLNGCANAYDTDRTSPSALCNRVHVSASFFRSKEFEVKGRYVFHFYRVGLGRSPTYAEFAADMAFVTRPTSAEVIEQINAFPARFAARPDFQQTAALPADQYVNALMNRHGLESITTPDPADPNGEAKVTLTRADLVNRLDAGMLTRAQVLRAVADSDQVTAAEFNRGFVTMQYFGYLRRDPEPAGHQAWLNHLNANPADFRTMVNGFMNSQEYRTRFGQP